MWYNEDMKSQKETDYRKVPSSSVYELKKVALRLRQKGKKVREICELTGLSDKTVRMAFAAYDNGGIDAIKPKIRGTPVSKFSKSKSAYKQKESNANPFFEDIWFVSKAAKNNSCQTVMPITKRDCCGVIKQKRFYHKRQYGHESIQNRQQICQSFNTDSASEHIISKRPELLLLVISDFDRPTHRIDGQWKKLYICFCKKRSFAQLGRGEIKIQFVRAFRADKKSLCSVFRFSNDGVNRLFAKKIGNYLTAANSVVCSINR